MICLFSVVEVGTKSRSQIDQHISHEASADGSSHHLFFIFFVMLSGSTGLWRSLQNTNSDNWKLSLIDSFRCLQYERRAYNAFPTYLKKLPFSVCFSLLCILKDPV